jgi:hypothetical protein
MMYKHNQHKRWGIEEVVHHIQQEYPEITDTELYSFGSDHICIRKWQIFGMQHDVKQQCGPLHRTFA